VNFMDSRYFLNRECTWLKFNQRVLQESIVPATPLLERLRFIAITSSNLDEFFMVRVAGVKHLIESGVNHHDIANLTPTEQLQAITVLAQKQVEDQYTYLKDLLTDLEKQGIRFLSVASLQGERRSWLEDYFEREIYPVVTPMAVDSSHPFPFLASRSLNLSVLLRKKNGDGSVHSAIMPVPAAVIDRIIRLPDDGDTCDFIFLEDILSNFADHFFVGYEILEASAFRITRDADMDIDADTEDLLSEVEKSLKKRRKGAAVRLELAATASRMVRRQLTSTLMLDDTDVYSIKGPLDCRVFSKFCDISGFDSLRYMPVTPQLPAELAASPKEDFWQAVTEHDIMVHHPYETFDVVEDFIKMAASDSQVLAIKQTLYRVSSKSPIISALAEAAENGKQVTVLMEVKARFDEANNILMARRLEKAGCHVIYGFMGLKTHSKITLVVRREEEGIRRYIHLATGNYNGSTARIYTDVGVFTKNPLIGMDASAFFNVLSGYSDPPVWNKLVVAPLNLRERIVAEINQEINWTKKGEKGYIIAKMNSLLDKKVIAKLYEASVAGVKIDLIIRGICVLRPGLEKISDNITVRSIVGRFLEHSRIFYFRNGGHEDVFISSADWMPRNLNDRVELMVPIEYEPHKKRLKGLLELYLRDNQKAYAMRSDGSYQRVPFKSRDIPINVQKDLQEQAEQAAATHLSQ
jgi:polyphosphate kinase